MTDMEKKVMLRLCAKVMQYADLSDDLEAENLVNWVLLDCERKQKNNEIRELMGNIKGRSRNGGRALRKPWHRGLSCVSGGTSCTRNNRR